MNSEWIKVGQRAYEYYGAVTNNKNVQGDWMPHWSKLPVVIQEAWVHQARMILCEFAHEYRESDALTDSGFPDAILRLT